MPPKTTKAFPWEDVATVAETQQHYKDLAVSSRSQELRWQLEMQFPVKSVLGHQGSRQGQNCHQKLA